MQATVSVCVPCRDVVDSGFAFDLARCVAAHTAATRDRVLLFQNQGTLIVNQRQELAQASLDAGATHILFIDADMRFPKDAIFRLLQRDEAIVAVNYSTRKLPLQPVAFRDDTTTERVYTEQDDTGLESVAAIGMGLMLIKAEVFQKMPKPWFFVPYQNGIYTGEDIFFCRTAREFGFEVLLDHDLSKEVRHIGAFEFSNAHACGAREERNEPSS
jgi:hypothetical protein